MQGSVEKTTLEDLKAQLQECTSDEARQALLINTVKESPNTSLLYLCETLVEIFADESQTELRVHVDKLIEFIFHWHAIAPPILTEQTLRSIKEPLLKLENINPLKAHLLTALMKLQIQHTEKTETPTIDLRLELTFFDTECFGATNVYFDIKDPNIRKKLFLFLRLKGFDVTLDNSTHELFIRINKKAGDHNGLSLNEVFNRITVALREFCDSHSIIAEFNLANTDAYIEAFEIFYQTIMTSQTEHKRGDYSDLGSPDGKDLIIRRLTVLLQELSIKFQTLNLVSQSYVQRVQAPSTQKPNGSQKPVSNAPSTIKLSEVFINPFKPRSRSLLTWLFTATNYTSLRLMIDGSRRQAAEKKIKVVDDTPQGFLNHVKLLLLEVFGFDGYNSIEKKAFAANGQYKIIDPTLVGWGILLASVFGLPNRPESINKSGKPILTATQLLFTNWVGGWTLTLNSKTWTLSQFLELPIKFLIILPINIIRVPINVVISIIKTFTLIPSLIIATILLDISFLPIGLSTQLITSKHPWAKYIRKNLDYIVLIAMFLSFIITIPLALAQYVAVWAVRISELLTTPAVSASKAFAAGRSLKISRFGLTAEMWISDITGRLGWVLSFALSTFLWTMILPILITAIVPAVAWFTHLSVVSASIAWVSQFPVVMAAFTATGNFVAPMCTAWSANFGPALTYAASLVGIQQISLMAMTAGTVLGMLGIPVIIYGNYLVDLASDLWVILHSTPAPRHGKTTRTDEIELLSKEDEETLEGFGRRAAELGEQREWLLSKLDRSDKGTDKAHANAENAANPVLGQTSTQQATSSGHGTEYDPNDTTFQHL